MALSDANKYWQRQAGEPASQFISSADAQAATTQIYYEFQQGDAALQTQITDNLTQANSRYLERVVVDNNLEDALDSHKISSDHDSRYVRQVANSVLNSYIADGAVTYVKLADDAVTTIKIQDSAVTAAKIADGAVTANKIGSNSVSSAKIVNGTIVDSNVSSSAGIQPSKIAGTAVVTGDSRLSDTRTPTDGSVTTAKIADSAVTSAKIADGAIVNADINASAAIDVSKLSGVVASATVGNLLTANQASIETDTTGFNNPFQCTLARSTAQYVSGSASLAVTATNTSFAFFTPLGTSGVPVTPGQTYTAQFSAKAGGNSGTLYVTIRFYNGATNLGDFGTNNTAVVSSSGWTTIKATVAAPANATHATLVVGTWTAVVTNDVFYCDQFGLWRGTGGDWALPGTPITGIADGQVTSAKIADGTIVNADVNASAAIDVSKLSGVVTSAGVGNLLTAGQASVETDVTGFYNNAPSNGTITYSTATALFGTGSALMTSTQAGAISFRVGKSSDSTVDKTPVTPGVYYTGSWWAKGAAATTILPRIYWYKSDHSASSTAYTLGTVVAVNGSTWTLGIVTGVAPADAAYGCINASWTASAAGEAVYFDKWGFWSGAGGTWRLPGVVIPNLGQYTDESVGRRIFTWDNVNNRYQMTYGDTGVRSLTLTPNAPASTLTVELRRMNNICHIDVQWTNGVITTPQVEFSLSDTALPAGFGNTRIARGVAWTNYLASAGGAIHIASGNILKANVVANGMAAAGGSTMQRSWTYTTVDAWPSSLPGTAIGSIPL